MDEDEECPRSGLSKSGCAHCGGLDEPPRRRWTGGGEGGWFAARYPGRCHNCSTPFGPGTLVKKIDDVYVAECCRERTD